MSSLAALAERHKAEKNSSSLSKNSFSKPSLGSILSKKSTNASKKSGLSLNDLLTSKKTESLKNLSLESKLEISKNITERIPTQIENVAIVKKDEPTSLQKRFKSLNIRSSR